MLGWDYPVPGAGHAEGVYVEGIGWKTRIDIMMKNDSVNQPT